MLICVTVLIVNHDLFSYFLIGNINNVDEPGPQLVVEPPPQGLFPLSEITPAEIKKCILSLKSGKANGPDGLAAEHYKLGGNRLPVFLSLILSCMSSPGYIPNSFMRSIIIPLVKDKTGDITDKNNYRPIALSTMSSKILERVIMNRYDQYFTTDNQFGFKTNHSTDMCVYSLKEIVNIYRNQSSPIFICFLDASKAFDKINYWYKLFYKLIRRDCFTN